MFIVPGEMQNGDYFHEKHQSDHGWMIFKMPGMKNVHERTGYENL